MDLTDNQREALEGLRGLADHLEANPELIDLIGHERFYVFHYGDDVAEFARKALLLGGKSDKNSDSTYFNVTRDFGSMVTLQVTAKHEQVCEKIVLDSQEIEVEELDEELAAAALANVPMRKVTKTVERTEWRCPTLLEAANS